MKVGTVATSDSDLLKGFATVVAVVGSGGSLAGTFSRSGTVVHVTASLYNLNQIKSDKALSK